MNGKNFIYPGQKKKLTILCCTFLLIGCTKNTTSTPSLATEAVANKIIADKVTVASQAQQEYASMVKEDSAILNKKHMAIDTEQIDVDYIGKPQELLQTFAYRYGYKYIESGKRRDLKQINILSKKTTPIEILKNVGFQLNQSADIILDKNTKVLRLVYKDTANN